MKTYKSPVKRVTNILKKMLMRDQCENKKKAVADEEAADQDMSTEIEVRSAHREHQEGHHQEHCDHGRSDSHS